MMLRMESCQNQAIRNLSGVIKSHPYVEAAEINTVALSPQYIYHFAQGKYQEKEHKKTYSS